MAEPVLSIAPEAGAEAGPMRRCLATGTLASPEEMLRFVVGPEGRIAVDAARRLPGRGLWLTARRDIVTEAVNKRLFARAAKVPVVVEAGLEDRIEAVLARRCGELLGLARRSGAVLAGFVKVRAGLAKGEAAVLVEAMDAAEDGRGKLGAAARGLPIVSCLSARETGAAIGREHAVHVALKPGRLADLFLAEARRLAGFRAGAKVDVSER
ncbi:MAG: RNA-binding protein [Stellaceae bacterium]